MSFVRTYFWPAEHRDVIVQMASRDIRSRYRQSWLGMAWLLLTPLLMLAVYTLVFKEVFRVRWAGVDESHVAFALRLYAGLVVFNFFAECVNRSPQLVTDQPNLVKKVVFPIEILPWASTLAALVPLGVGAALLLGLTLGSSGGLLPWTSLGLLWVWLPLLPLCLGLGWALSALGAYVRDIGQVLGLAMAALLFLSPVFFPMEALPARMQKLMVLNPLAAVITQTREVLIAGKWPALDMWAVNAALALVVAGLGAWVFERLRPGFADVL